MKKMIEINGLYKSYTDEEEVVKDIHMKVEKGTIHGLIGHNGSGKTTIIKCVTGIYPPDRGEVLLGGEPVYENVKVKEKIGYEEKNDFNSIGGCRYPYVVDGGG